MSIRPDFKPWVMRPLLKTVGRNQSPNHGGNIFSEGSLFQFLCYYGRLLNPYTAGCFYSFS